MLELSADYLNNCSINFKDVNITIWTYGTNIYNKSKDLLLNVINFTKLNSYQYFSNYIYIIQNHCKPIKHL